MQHSDKRSDSHFKGKIPERDPGHRNWAGIKTGSVCKRKSKGACHGNAYDIAGKKVP